MSSSNATPVQTQLSRLCIEAFQNALRATLCATLLLFTAGCEDEPVTPVDTPTTPVETPKATVVSKPKKPEITLPFHGTVVDSFGVANPGVIVAFEPSTETAFRGDASASTASDITAADGSFEIRIPKSQLPAHAGPGFQPRCALRKKGYLTRRLPLAVATASAEDRRYSLYEGGVLEGTVKDEAGQAITGITVRVAGHGGYDDHSVVNVDGTFAISAPEGTLLLSLHGDHFADLRVYDVTLTSEETTQREFIMKRGHTLKVVVSNEGRPLKGAVLRVRTQEGDDTEATTNHLGECTIEGLNAGRATCKVYCPGFGERFERFTMKQSQQHLGFNLARAPYWQQEVVNPRGDTLQGAEVEIHRHNQLLVRATVDSRQLQILNPGERYELRFFAPGYPTRSYTYRLPKEELLPVVRATMTRGGSLVGRVEDSHGIPLADATVMIIALQATDGGRGANLLAAVNPDGSFRSALLNPGKYRIQASHPRTAQIVKEEITVGEGDQKVGTLTLGPRS